MKVKKINIARTVFILITASAAIIIFSLTIGKDWFEGRDQSIHSFAIIHFAGYLFFLLMPVEMAFAYCVSIHSEIWLIILLALGTAISAQIIDYLIGYSVSSKIIGKYIGNKKSERAKKYIRKYGNLTILAFNLLPLSSPIICLAAGMVNYPFKKVLLYSGLGLAIKYLVLLFIFS